MKGLKFLLEAVAKFRTERHMELTIIGKRRPDSHASQTMTALGLDDCVNFVSGVPDERIVELYSEAELACVPSLYEGFSSPPSRPCRAAPRSSAPPAAPCPR